LALPSVLAMVVMVAGLALEEKEALAKEKEALGMESGQVWVWHP